MKKILFPALATLLTVAASAAFAQSSAGSWYVLSDANTHACYATDRAATSGEAQLAGPYASQSRALAALASDAQCDGQFGSQNNS